MATRVVISITKVVVTNLPTALQGTPGLFRVRFQAGTARAETIPRAAAPDGLVEWSEPLEITVHDTNASLVAIVQHSHSRSPGRWNIVPGGIFTGEVVAALPYEWYDVPPAPTVPTFYARLSVEVKQSMPLVASASWDEVLAEVCPRPVSAPSPRAPRFDHVKPMMFENVVGKGVRVDEYEEKQEGGRYAREYEEDQEEEEEEEEERNRDQEQEQQEQEKKQEQEEGRGEEEREEGREGKGEDAPVITSGAGDATAAPVTQSAPKKKWFHKLKRLIQGSSEGVSASAAGSKPGHGRAASVPAPWSASLAIESKGQEELRETPPPAAGTKVSGKWRRVVSGGRLMSGRSRYTKGEEHVRLSAKRASGVGGSPPHEAAEQGRRRNEEHSRYDMGSPIASPIASPTLSVISRTSRRGGGGARGSKLSWSGVSSFGSSDEEDGKYKIHTNAPSNRGSTLNELAMGWGSRYGLSDKEEDGDKGYEIGYHYDTMMDEPQRTRNSRPRGDSMENLLGYSAMPQSMENLLSYLATPQAFDGSDHAGGDQSSRSPAMSPNVRQRQHNEPSASAVPVAPETTSGKRVPRSLVPLQNASTASERTSASGASGSVGMPPEGDVKRAVAGAALAVKEAVIFSCFAPPAIRPGTSFALKVSAYLRRARDAVLREALSEGAVEAGRPEGMSIAKGKRVTVHLLLPEDVFRVLPPLYSSGNPTSTQQPSVRDFVWTGEGHAVEFRVGCKVGVAPGRYSCEAMVIEARNVKRLTFVIEVVGRGFAPRALDAGSNGEVELDTVMKEERGNVAEVRFEELKFVREIGRGVQGVTSHCRWRDKDVAVKSLTSFPAFDPSRGPTRSGLEHEATILSLLGWHPNIVEFYGLCRHAAGAADDGSVHVVTRLAEGGSIEAALGVARRNGGGRPMNGGRFATTAKGGKYGNERGYGSGLEFDGNARATWARDIARGLADSHAAGVLHNDVASRNALLSTAQPGGLGLLCDFGISRFLRAGVEAASLIDTELDDNKWPVLQMPRECLEPPYPLTAESDSWMYGLFLYEVFEGRQPWAGLDKREARRLVMEGKRPPKVPEMLKERGSGLVNLYERCLSADSTKRPSLEEVVQYFS